MADAGATLLWQEARAQAAELLNNAASHEAEKSIAGPYDLSTAYRRGGTYWGFLMDELRRSTEFDVWESVVNRYSYYGKLESVSARILMVPYSLFPRLPKQLPEGQNSPVDDQQNDHA